jgi:hypothetical protein
VHQPVEALDEKGLDLLIAKGAGPDGASFFLRLRPDLQLTSWLFMTNLLWTLRSPRSGSGSDSSSDSSSEQQSPE